MKRLFTAGLVSSAFLMFNLFSAQAQDSDQELAALKTQVQALLKRIEILEQEQARSKEALAQQKETLAKQQESPVQKVEPTVLMDKLISKLKIKGRWAGGYLKSGKAGSYSSGSFELPDAKLLFILEPDDINKVILRMNLDNAKFNSLDYSYLETNLTKLLNLRFPLTTQIGRMRLDIGEENLWNNPIEGVLPSNSASNVDGKDEGLRIMGKLGKEKPLIYHVSITNGSSGTGSDTSTPKAFTGKLGYNILDPLYVSASYYNSGDLKSSDSEVKIAGLTSRPGNAAKWKREVWEVDLRYDFKKGKVPDPPAFSESKAILRLAYGNFRDSVSTSDALGPSAKRTGQYGFAEGIYNLSRKFYLAGRISFVDLGDDTIASLNNISCNEYQRYSLGMGYRLTGNVILKLSYDWNEESGPGVDVGNDNLISALATAQF